MIANHLIFGTYAHWLPNDERGSWSGYIRNKKLLVFGKTTKISTNHSLTHLPYDKECRQKIEAVLKFPLVRFNGVQACAVGRGFAQAVTESHYVVFACAIMPTHVHLVVAAHKNLPRQIIGHFKGRATHYLNQEGLNPLGENRSPWCVKGWTVFLDSDDAVWQAIEYVNHNPLEEGLPLQQWKFVTPYI
ncbi:MAG: transposase [Planctomycetaceae bacterium]|jgi:REP element-mobilizing transposase RayT|nr:transposase [Planctomycetaceae bacterium]